MICPKCGSKVVRVYSIKEGNVVYRKRKCDECGTYIFTKITEVECSPTEVTSRINKRANENYRKKCIKMWQEKKQDERH